MIHMGRNKTVRAVTMQATCFLTGSRHTARLARNNSYRAKIGSQKRLKKAKIRKEKKMSLSSVTASE